jgi:hypothetical protein
MPPFLAFSLLCRRRLFLRACFVISLLVLNIFAQEGAVVRHQSLDEMVQEADTIVHGTVTSAKVEPHPQLSNLTTLLVTMAVQDTLKGKAVKTLQFRQYIWDIRDRLNAAKYVKGEEVLLLLTPVSQYGLSSPVGLEQGRFRIRRGADGVAMAVNGQGNANLFRATAEHARAKGIVMTATTRRLAENSDGPVPLSDLKAVIRNFSGVK